MTFGGILGNIGMGAGDQKDQAMLGTFSLIPGKGEGQKIELIIMWWSLYKTS